jgi:hypothetical protein
VIAAEFGLVLNYICKQAGIRLARRGKRVVRGSEAKWAEARRAGGANLTLGFEILIEEKEPTRPRNTDLERAKES